MQTFAVSKNSSDDVSRRGTAFHEAGHAVIQYMFGMMLKKVSILPIGESIAGVSLAAGRHPLELSMIGAYYEGTIAYDRRICHHIMATQAGEVAQQLFCPESVEEFHAALDRRSVRRAILIWN